MSIEIIQLRLQIGDIADDVPYLLFGEFYGNL